MLLGAHITLLPQLKRGEERKGMDEVCSISAIIFLWVVFYIDNKWYLQGPSSTFNDSQVLGERVEFEVVRAGPSFPIRYWRGQEAVYRFFFTSLQVQSSKC